MHFRKAKIVVALCQATARNSPPDCCVYIFESPSVNAIPIKKPPHRDGFLIGGPEEIRTPDPYNANVMRSQLRYRPITVLIILLRECFVKRQDWKEDACTGVLLWGLFLKFVLFVCGKTLIDQPCSQKCKTDAKTYGEKHIGRIVDIQIQPGKCDQTG